MGDVVYEAVPGNGVTQVSPPNDNGNQCVFEGERAAGSFIGPDYPATTAAFLAAGLIRPVVRRPETPGEWIGKKVRFQSEAWHLVLAEHPRRDGYLVLVAGYSACVKHVSALADYEVEGESVPPPPPQFDRDDVRRVAAFIVSTAAVPAVATSQSARRLLAQAGEGE